MPSFDVVSQVDMQEVRNAWDQTKREIATRYDFRGSKSEIDLKEDKLIILTEDDLKLRSIQEILRQKFAKRQVSLKSVIFNPSTRAGGDMHRQEVDLKLGLKDEELRRINRLIKDLKLKVTSQIQGAQLRITGKKKDDLQNVIKVLREQVADIELQFINFRD